MSNEQSFSQRYLSGLFNVTGNASVVGSNVNMGNVHDNLSTDSSTRAHDSSALGSLLRAIADLQAELPQFRSDIPPADAEDAEDALADARMELARTSPEVGVLRRRVAMVADAVADVAPLAPLAERLHAHLAEYLASRSDGPDA